jgi:two-component system phosphate regulon sensor histidine kinase PhoR
MTTAYGSGKTSGRLEGLLVRLARARRVLAVALVIFALLWATGALALVLAVTGFAVIGFAALVLPSDRDSTRATTERDVRAAPPAGNALIERVLAGLPDPVIALDRDGTVIAFNHGASDIAPALRRGEPVSVSLRTPEVVEAIRRAATTGTAQRVEFFERVPANRWYQAFVTPVKGAAAETDSGIMLMTFHDLTPLRRVEEMRADFVANASHELRTPLAAVLGFIETLQGSARDDPEARTRFLAIMQAQATRMARLIDDLLSLSRIELNAHLRPNTEADLVAVVRQVVDGLQMLALERSVEVKVAAPAGPLIVLGDRDELMRVFENLIENALKYGASGKRVEVTLSTDQRGREARVAVRDYGPGIAAEHLPRLTERFYRVDVVDSRAQGGTGLGLALVKHILNRHGGRLSIDSALGRGAIFTAHLPLPTGPTPGAL